MKITISIHDDIDAGAALCFAAAAVCDPDGEWLHQYPWDGGRLDVTVDQDTAKITVYKCVSRLKERRAK